MLTKRKAVFVVPGSLFTALILIVGLTFFIVRTSAFKREIRSRVVSSLERATGGRVELGSLHLYWSSLTVRLDNLVIHGTEPAGSPPLLQAASIGMQLKAASLLKQRIDFSSVVAERPAAYLLVRADGSTNIPTPHLDGQDVINQLVDLAVKRFVLDHGTLLINQKRYPLNVKGQDLHALASYDPGRRAYHLGLSAHRMAVTADCCRDLPLAVDIQAVVSKSVIDVHDANVISGSSTLHVSGTVRHFNQPQADFRFRSDIDARQAAQFVKLDALRDGNLLLDGSGRFDLQSGFTVDGNLRARRLAYRSPMVAASDLDLASGFHFANGALLLNKAVAKAFGGDFEGSAKLEVSHALQLSGRLVNVNLQQLAASFNKRIPWSGLASGQVSIHGRLPSVPRDLAIETAMQITPAKGGIPLSGTLDFSKTARSDLNFGRSQLVLPNTQTSFHGSAGTGIEAVIDTTNFGDLASVLDFLKIKYPAEEFPMLLSGGSAHFNGTLAGSLFKPEIEGALSLTRLKTGRDRWDQLNVQGSLTPHSLDFSSLAVDSALVHASGSGHIELHDWQVFENAPVRLHANYKDADVPALLSRFTSIRLPLEHGTASGTLDISGTLQQPSGNAHLVIKELSAYGEAANRLAADAVFSANDLRIEDGSLAGVAGGRIAFSGLYTHASGDWQNGHLSARMDGGDLRVHDFRLVRSFAPDLAGSASANAQFAANVINGSIHPVQIDGHVALRNLLSNGMELGSVNANVSTQSQAMNFALKGDLRDSRFHGNAQVKLIQDAPVTGALRFDRISLSTLQSLIRPDKKQDLPLQGFMNGGIEFQGSLAHIRLLHSSIHVDHLQLNSLLEPEFDLHNPRPIVLDVSGGKAAIRSFELVGKDTKLSVSGSAGYSRMAPVNIDIDGSVGSRGSRAVRSESRFERPIAGKSIGRGHAQRPGSQRAPRAE